MGRPTTEKKEKTVKLRISEELYNEVVGRGENVSETIRGMIRDSLVPQNPSKVKPRENSVPQKGIEDALVVRCKDEETEKIFKEARYEEVTIVKNDYVPQNPLSEKLVGQIEHMCSFFKIDAETFLKEVCKGLESGKIGYENGLKTYGTLDTERFEDACHDKGVDPEKMLEKATQMVWKV